MNTEIVIFWRARFQNVFMDTMIVSGAAIHSRAAKSGDHGGTRGTESRVLQGHSTLARRP